MRKLLSIPSFLPKAEGMRINLRMPTRALRLGELVIVTSKRREVWIEGCTSRQGEVIATRFRRKGYIVSRQNIFP